MRRVFVWSLLLVVAVLALFVALSAEISAVGFVEGFRFVID